MAHAIRSTSVATRESYVGPREASSQAEDDLGFAAALKFAIPAGIVLWALGIWSVIHFFM